MTEAAHPTTTPEQVQTDTFAVFAGLSPQFDTHNTLVLIGRVEVPRYTQPSADGVEMGMDKRLSLALYRALKESHHPEPIPGEEFMVMTDLEGPMSFVEYEANPAFDGVWNPTEGDR